MIRPKYEVGVTELQLVNFKRDTLIPAWIYP
jgi:hypothetical protein